MPPSAEPTSLRDYIVRQLPLKHASAADLLVMPEDLPDWATDSVYGDIFEMEQHLAALASSVVIFVESPGSIAELGAFCLLPGVDEKLLVFVQDRHFSQASFIRFGPLRRLEQINSRSVFSYPWETIGSGSNERIVTESVEAVRDEICEAIARSVRPTHPNRLAKGGDHGDRMLIICELLSQMIGLTLHEICEFLRQMGAEVSIATLKRYLYILQHVRLIDKVRRGHSELYRCATIRQFIRFGIKDGAQPFDRDRLIVAIAEYYRKHDRPRHLALSPLAARVT